MISLSQYITEKNWDTYTKQMYDDPVKNAVWNYVAGYTTGVNNDLRAGKGGSKNVKKYLDQAFVNKQELDVYRVVDWDYMKNIYNITPETLDNFIGKTITNKAYMSTSKKNTSVWGTTLDGDLYLHIVSKKPYPCIDINSVLPAEDIDCEDQEEILLPRDTSLKILRYSQDKNGVYLIETEIV